MSPEWEQRVREFLEREGLKPDNFPRIVQALTHRSYSFENAGMPDNERLEFLGDAVLGCMAAEFLFFTHPAAPEGDLSRMRSFLVSGRELFRRACELGMDDLILMGKGEEDTGGRHRVSTVGSALEALAGALYLNDPSAPALREFVRRRVLEPGLRALERQMHPDHKSRLQEITQKHGMGKPVYVRTGEDGPAHERRFYVEVRIDGVCRGKGQGARVKTAENHAAKIACDALTE